MQVWIWPVSLPVCDKLHQYILQNLRYLSRFIYEDGHNWRVLIAVQNKAHLIELLSEVPAEEEIKGL